MEESSWTLSLRNPAKFTWHMAMTCREVIETLTVESMRHQVLLSTGSATELIERSVIGDADVIIASPHLADMDGIDALIRIGERNPTPSIVVSRSSDLDHVERAMEDSCDGLSGRTIDGRLAVAFHLFGRTTLSLL